MKSPVCFFMYINPINNCTCNIINTTDIKNKEIPFGRIGIDGSRMQNFFTHLPCPCCGLKRMLTYDDIKLLTDLPEDTPAGKMLPLLAKYKDSLHPVEKEIFYTLKDLAQFDPEANLRELLDTQRDLHLKLLKYEELEIIENLRRAIKQLPPKFSNKIHQILSETKSILKSSKCNEQFKRKIFIGRIKHALENCPNRAVFQTISEIAETMPKASNNVSAFIVKHTERNPYTGEQRTSKGIIQAMLAPSLATVEHIKVRSNKVKGGGGRDEMGNYLLECARDNNARGSIPFYEFVRLHPEYYGRHLQRYVNKIIRKINHYRKEVFAKYPECVQKTLLEESKGLVNVDISKLNLNV